MTHTTPNGLIIAPNGTMTLHYRKGSKRISVEFTSLSAVVTYCRDNGVDVELRNVIAE